jgi:competence protein ComEC
MNTYVERIEALPFSVWPSLQISIWQALLLFLFVTGIGYWLLEKNKHGLPFALLAILFFLALRAYSFGQAARQQKIIVYNIPQYNAVDFIDGRAFKYVGDPALMNNEFCAKFSSKAISHPAKSSTTVFKNKFYAPGNLHFFWQ